RIVAVIEVVLCSDFLTQYALAGTLKSLGYNSFVNGRLSAGYVAALSLGDAVLLVALIVLILYAHGERPRDVLVGRRPVVPEIAFGVPLILVALTIALTVLVLVQQFAPSLHTVPQNPLQDLLRSPRDAWLFALVVLVAGGAREELQRAFLLHRFETWLGGPLLRLVINSRALRAGPLVPRHRAAHTTGP